MVNGSGNRASHRAKKKEIRATLWPALWIPGNELYPPPPEYSDLELCRLFHCLPDELDRQDPYRMGLFVYMMQIENEIQEEKKGFKKA